MKKNTLLLFILLSTFNINAQEKNASVTKEKKEETVNRSPSGFIRCASVEYEELLRKNNPKRFNDAQFEEWLAPLIEKEKNATSNRSETGGIIYASTSPIVFNCDLVGDFEFRGFEFKHQNGDYITQSGGTLRCEKFLFFNFPPKFIT